MDLIEESNINNFIIKYYTGFNFDSIIEHPKDGSNGMMVVFIDSIKNEETIYKRESNISFILDKNELDNFYDILENLDNPYLALYETHGYTDIIYKSIKNKFENYQHIPWKYNI